MRKPPSTCAFFQRLGKRRGKGYKDGVGWGVDGGSLKYRKKVTKRVLEA